jgi:hypothetical protein
LSASAALAKSTSATGAGSKDTAVGCTSAEQRSSGLAGRALVSGGPCARSPSARTGECGPDWGEGTKSQMCCAQLVGDGGTDALPGGGLLVVHHLTGNQVLVLLFCSPGTAVLGSQLTH